MFLLSIFSIEIPVIRILEFMGLGIGTMAEIITFFSIYELLDILYFLERNIFTQLHIWIIILSS